MPSVFKVRRNAHSFYLPHRNLLHYNINRKTVSIERSYLRFCQRSQQLQERCIEANDNRTCFVRKLNTVITYDSSQM